jgi:hypothetical protein
MDGKPASPVDHKARGFGGERHLIIKTLPVMKSLDQTIIELWHISRTALATQDISRHSRMVYIKQELARTYPKLIEGMTGKAVWFAIEDAIA